MQNNTETRRTRATNFCKAHWRKASVAAAAVGVTALVVWNNSACTTASEISKRPKTSVVAKTATGIAYNAHQYKNPTTGRYAVDPNKHESKI